MTNSQKIKAVDLFAGCGGLMDGFEQSNLYNMIAAVEWEEVPCHNLRNRLRDKWKIKDADRRVLCFDIQRTEELFRGWNESKYGTSEGLDCLVEEAKGIDVIIGGPPCQAYSVAGRVRDKNGMKDDYRNFLFESYLEVVKKYKPKIFVFENVPGILSAKPGDRPITEIIRESFDESGYYVLPNFKNAVIDFSDYGVPQKRNRVIIVGLSKEFYGDECETMLNMFYDKILPSYKTKKKRTVRDAIEDLPKLYPLQTEKKYEGRKISHSLPEPFVNNHVARWQNKRDRGIFETLAEDIASGKKKYTSTSALKKLYTEKTGKTSNVYKYHVLRWEEQSNLIPAHLYKDGLRHIHPDPKQSRTITVREAARLQSFSDDYVFVGSNMETYKMIGNAVPPLFAKYLAKAVRDLFSYK